VPTFYLAGDYDDDRDVDGADFLIWQQQLGAAVLKNTAADGDGNGYVDAADLAVWQADFGEQFSGGVAAQTPIPEPTTIALLAIGSCLATAKRFIRGKISGSLPLEGRAGEGG
jgi:hypothetical protein